ncbi:MAG: hypothetical protein Q7T56_07980 [Nocardioidaceae bacterium]|nr:hypothetical protein [Nocardioidaceae bacterium]
MVVVHEQPARRPRRRRPVPVERSAAPLTRTGRRVRHEVADGAAVIAFSLATSVVLAGLIGLGLHLAG